MLNYHYLPVLGSWFPCLGLALNVHARGDYEKVDGFQEDSICPRTSWVRRNSAVMEAGTILRLAPPRPQGVLTQQSPGQRREGGIFARSGSTLMSSQFTGFYL